MDQENLITKEKTRLQITPNYIEKISRKMLARRKYIASKFGIRDSEMRRVYPLNTGAYTFYKICCHLVETPAYILYDDQPVTQLPETREEYEATVKTALHYFRLEYSEAELGNRLRFHRKRNNLTLKEASEQLQEIMKEFPEKAKAITSYQAIGAHERGKKKNISIFMLMGYCYLYGIDSLDALMIGKPFGEIIEKAKETPIIQAETKERTQESSQFRDILLSITNGKCERCNQKAPFEINGVPYLEIFYFDHKAEEHRNIRNAVALCPNCKSRIQMLHEENEIKKLKEKASEHT